MLVLWAGPAAAGPDVRIGGRVGAEWNLLQKPTDPEGAPTLMSGTAFEGIGVTAGPTLALVFPAFEAESLRAGLLTGLSYARHRAKGFERDRNSPAERVATLTTHAVHVSAMGTLFWQLGGGELRWGLGAALMHGLASDATVELHHADGEPGRLSTATTTHVPLVGSIAYRIRASERVGIPIEWRVAWDPWVGDSTVDRFRNFQPRSPYGDYEVAFDWRIAVMIGMEWRLTGD
ncbi:MAG: hypothetical protein ABEL76_10680 [Bradymonadaceae bacterium]